MIQEIIALSIFALAVLYGFYQLGRFVIPAKKTKATSSCSAGSCGCKP